jgi:hypothetical protein
MSVIDKFLFLEKAVASIQHRLIHKVLLAGTE